MKRNILSVVVMLIMGMGVMSAADYVTTEKSAAVTKGVANGYGWVDMGLSVRWATMNIGAEKPEDIGSFIAWGETKSKKRYDWSTYLHIQGGAVGQTEESDSSDIEENQVEGQINNATRYMVATTSLVFDNKTPIEEVDAASVAYWGGNWGMPSQSDWEELSGYCKKEWTTVNGVKGYKLTGKNGNYIFLPAVGHRSDANLSDLGSNGCYWSSTLANNHQMANYLHFGENVFDPTGSYSSLCFGLSVRLVISATGDINGHIGIDLGLPSGKLWATCNVGASKPEERGSYIAWGELESKSIYSWVTYKYEFKEDSDWQYICKYQKADKQRRGIWYDQLKSFIGDGKTTLEAEDDAATANWGKEWRMPTQAEWAELTNKRNCIWVWKEVNGVKGYEVFSKKTGNTIFLPAAGYFKNGTHYGKGSDGYYSSSELGENYTSHAEVMYFKEGYFSPSFNSYRCFGYLVRAVCPMGE